LGIGQRRAPVASKQEAHHRLADCAEHAGQRHGSLGRRRGRAGYARETPATSNAGSNGS